MYSYLSQLREITHLKPHEGSWLFGKENTEHYIARALQWAVKEDKLGEVINKVKALR